VHVANLALVAVLGMLHSEDSVTLIEDGDFATPLPSSWEVHSVKADLVKLKGKPFSRVLHLDVDATHKDAALLASTIAMVHLGDTVAIRVWMRGYGNAALEFAEVDDPTAKLVEGHGKLTPKWKEYRFAGSSKSQYLAGEAKFGLRFSQGGEWADVARLRVEDLGDATPDSIHPTTDPPRH
jgi:hypothetical protein